MRGKDFGVIVEQIAALAEVDDYIDQQGNINWEQWAHEVTNGVIWGMKIFAWSTVSADLHAMDRAAAYPSPTTNFVYEWLTKYEQRPPEEPRTLEESWRRWTTGRIAKFVVDGIAKIMPPFWWIVDYGDAVIAAASIIDNWRGAGVEIDGAPPELDWDAMDFVLEVFGEIIGY